MAHLIDKSALVAEIENRIKNLNERLIKHPISSPTLEKLIEENKKVLSFINTLEVKESLPLAWQDIRLISEIGESFMNSEESDHLSEEEYYAEILNRFNMQKEK